MPASSPSLFVMADRENRPPVARVAWLAFVFLAGTAPAQAQFSVLETRNVKLVYLGGLHSYIAPYAARCFENALGYHCRFWDYHPSERVTVTLYDFSDYGNAGATATPENRISVLMAPLSYAYETSPANEKINTVMNHELVHIMALDKATGRDRLCRRLFFGKVKETSENPLSIAYAFLTTPRASAARWYHEGMAVFLETWMAGGMGRALGPYDEMVFRTKVCDTGRFYDPVGLESEGTKIDFQVGVNSYLYGTRFFTYLAHQYGPESLIRWVSRTPGSSAYYVAQFKNVYGLSLDREWAHWIAWEHQFQARNLAAIRKYPVTPYRRVPGAALGSVSRPYYDSTRGRLLAGVSYPGQVAHLAAIDLHSGKAERICEIKGATLYFVTSLAYDPESGTLFYTTDNDDWRDLVAVDLNTKRSRCLLTDARIGDLAFNAVDSSLWGIRHYNGYSSLVRIPAPYDTWDLIRSWPYGDDLYDIDLSPDGRLVTGSLAGLTGRQTLVALDMEGLLAGDTSYTVLHDFGNTIPANFTFSADGRYLYGSAYYTGVSNLFRYDLQLDSMEIVSNCETGLFRPLPISSDSLVAFRYTDRGFVPVVMAIAPLVDVSAVTYLGQALVDRHPLIKEWICPSPVTVNIDSLTVSHGTYRGIANLRLVSMYPIVEGYRSYAAYGMRLTWDEPVGYHSGDLTISYTPTSGLASDERWHVDANYAYVEWQFGFAYNDADFYDLFGPTKTSRKGYSLGLERRHMLLYDTPRTLEYTLRATGFADLERLPDYQNVATSYDKFLAFGGNLDYKNLRASLGAVDQEKGHKWQLSFAGTYVNRKLYPRVSLGVDWGVPILLPHSSLWARASAGYSPGKREEPFANFFFGGFGNNWVDAQTEKRYRAGYSFPGVELNEIAGTTYGKLIMEWNLPPMRFRRLGGSAFYLTWIRPAVFATALRTNLDSRDYRQTRLNLGGQLDFRLTLLSHLALTVSAGYASAFTTDWRRSDETMFSLKIL